MSLQIASSTQQGSFMPYPLYPFPHPTEPAKRRHARFTSDESSDNSPLKKRKKQHYADMSFSSNGSPDNSSLMTSQTQSLSPLLTWCKQHRGNCTGWERTFTQLREDDIELDSFTKSTKITARRLGLLCPTLKLATIKRLGEAHHAFSREQRKAILFN